MKPIEQMLQTYGRSSECVRMWFLYDEFCANAFWQMLHVQWDDDLVPPTATEVDDGWAAAGDPAGGSAAPLGDPVGRRRGPAEPGAAAAEVSCSAMTADVTASPTGARWIDDTCMLRYFSLAKSRPHIGHTNWHAAAAAAAPPALLDVVDSAAQ